MITAKIHVRLKKGILDPQGKTVHHALKNLGLPHITEIRMGKLVEMNFDNATKEEAQALSEEACKKLLANPVIEDYEIELIER